MKQLVVEDERYYYALMGIIVLFLAYNLWATTFYMNLLGILPITLQILLLYLLTSKNQYSKLAIKLWAGIFLIGISSIKVMAIAIEGWAKNMKGETDGTGLIVSSKMIISLIFLIVGIIVFILIQGVGSIEKKSDS